MVKPRKTASRPNVSPSEKGMNALRFANRFTRQSVANKDYLIDPPGGHALREDETFKVVYGDQPKPFSASLEDIENYLEALEAGEG